MYKLQTTFAKVLCSLLLLSTTCTHALNVVVSIPPLNALTEGVLQGVSTPTLLVPANASHHAYVLKPSNRRALQQADFVVWIGTSLEVFLEKPISQVSSSTQVITIDQLSHLTLYPTRNSEHTMHDHAHTSAIDPHIWLNPHNAIVIIQHLTEAFSKRDPTHANVYKKNAAAMIKEIEQLDKELQQELSSIKNKPFLVFHDGYQYFEKYYQLRAVGSVALHNDLPPSAQQIHHLQKKIQQEHITCLFVEPTTATAVTDMFKRDTAIRIGTLDSIGQGIYFSDYLALLRYDAEQLVICLGQPQNNRI